MCLPCLWKRKHIILGFTLLFLPFKKEIRQLLVFCHFCALGTKRQTKQSTSTLNYCAEVIPSFSKICSLESCWFSDFFLQNLTVIITTSLSVSSLLRVHNLLLILVNLTLHAQVTVSGEVNTPCGVAQVEFIDPREPVKVKLQSVQMWTSQAIR